MSYRVVITETARQDLREIAFWIAQQSHDKAVAKRFLTGLKAEIKKLDTFQNAGAIPKDRTLMLAGFRYLVYKDYLVFYSVADKKKDVYVLAIFNAKKDYMRVMRQFI